MPRSFSLPLAAFAALSASAVLASTLYAQAPIERNYADQSQAQAYPQPTPPPNASGYGQAPYGSAPYGQPAPNNPPAPSPVSTSQPIQGVYVRAAQGASVQTVSANANGAEIRITSGLANIVVRHPAADVQIVVDLPGGQAALVKDGLYTFNAQTNTLGVLEGEADALPGNHEPIRIKENHQFVFAAGGGHPKDANEAELRQDLLPPGPYAGGGSGYARGDGYYGNGYPGYAYGPYGDGYYGGYPYYAYGPYPYGWYGYPYIGLGFGYYGGWGRGWGGGWGGYRGGGWRR